MTWVHMDRTPEADGRHHVWRFRFDPVNGLLTWDEVGWYEAEDQ